MRSLILGALLAVSGVSAASAQAIIVMRNTDYDCAYIVQNFEAEEDVRLFMIEYTFGFLSGVNAHRMVSGQPVIDFGPIENPMLITWAHQVCTENQEMNYAEALFRLYEVLLNQQQGG